MRLSAVRLAETKVRLADLMFPSQRVQIHRTRLAFIHLENLLHFAKIDRDGRVDGYVAAYLPDSVALLFFKCGEVATAVAFTEAGRTVVSIASVLRDMEQEMERGELAFCDAPMEQLAWMYHSCASAREPKLVDAQNPETIFPALQHERFSGVLELISNGKVSYFQFDDGRFINGYFSGKAEQATIAQHVESLFRPGADGARPQVAASVFRPDGDLPEQASPAMIQNYRELFWRILAVAEQQVPGEAHPRGVKLRDALAKGAGPLGAIGAPLDQEAAEVVVRPDQLTQGLADWTRQLLQQLEIIAPGVAATIVRDATKEHRFVLQKAGFYQTLPWNVSW
ncbi:MAG: hypothetical protein HYW06_12165 [Gemmatimonadetes bacterium]|nr:hypothetical protein [Gemmatimonadota bacterium]